MARKIFRTGNSLVVSLPRDVLDALRLGQGAEVDVELDQERGVITIAPVALTARSVDTDFARQVSAFIEQYRPALAALASDWSSLGRLDQSERMVSWHEDRMTANDPLLTWHPITLHLHQPFRVSYGTSTTRRAFWIRLRDDTGWGEGTIPPYYGVPEESMTAFWDAMARRTGALPDDPAAIEAFVGHEGPAPARCAVDLALHDRLGRQRQQPLYRLLGLPRPPVLPTCFTIAIAAPEEMAETARQAARYSILKVKLGTEDDAARLAAVRQARPDARLRVDANAGWAPEEAVQRLRELAPLRLELVEQPVGREDIEGMGYVQAHATMPVVADESVQTMRDVEQLAAAGVQGVNLKLMKVGGLAPGLRMVRRARELGLRVMLGCMVETSLGVTAMAHLAGLADWLDLDAPLLVANDPFAGITYDEQGGVHLPERPGIGAVLARAPVDG